MRELESAVRGLLREHWTRSEHLQQIYEYFSFLIELS